MGAGFRIDIQIHCEKAFKKKLKIKFLIRDFPVGFTLTKGKKTLLRNQSYYSIQIKKTVELIDLKEKIDVLSKNLSGGQKRKLSVGIAILGDPKVTKDVIISIVYRQFRYSDDSFKNPSPFNSGFLQLSIKLWKIQNFTASGHFS